MTSFFICGDMAKNRFLVSILHTSHVIQTRHYQSSSTHKGHPWYKFQLHTISRTWNSRGPVHPTVRKKLLKIVGKNCWIATFQESKLLTTETVATLRFTINMFHMKHFFPNYFTRRNFYERQKSRIGHCVLLMSHMRLEWICTLRYPEW